jgi:hypothetical protein
MRRLLITVAALGILTLGEPAAQGWLDAGAQARAGRVCYQRCTRLWKWPSARCRAHCQGRPWAPARKQHDGPKDAVKARPPA